MQHWAKIKYVFHKENLLVALVYAFMFIAGSILGHLLLTSTASEIQSKESVPVRKLQQSTTPWPQFITSQSHQIKNSRILCWVLTSPQNTFKAAVVRDTWGRKCDKLLFMSSVNDTSLPAIGLPVKESREMLWEKVKMSVHHLYTHHLNYYDWFFKADDDTFTILENLRRFLSPYNSSEPYFIGREFETNHHGTFFSGGSGYLLSKEALRRIVESGFAQNKCRFKPKDTSEDVNMAKCVKEVNGTFGSSTDEFGRQRFMPFRLEDFYSGNSRPGVGINWMRSSGIQFKLGYECCSNEAITFHYVSGHDMQMYNYLLYGVKIDNVSRKQT